jgi:hypothetical protein
LKDIEEFVNEFSVLQALIIKVSPELKSIVHKIKLEQNKKNLNIKASVCSFFLQEKEVQILEHLFIYCQQKEYIKNGNCILCADGLMIKKEYYKESLLNEFKVLIKDKTGFDLNFSTKEMNKTT